MNLTNILELFKPVDKMHTGCKYCNYQGCIWAREHNPEYGHWHWTFECVKEWLGWALNLKRQYNRLVRYLTQFDYSKIDDIQVDGINTRDYPDFCDAYICYATYKGKEMTDSQLERLNEDYDFVYECVMDRIY